MKISLPDTPKPFVDEQVSQRGCAMSSEAIHPAALGLFDALEEA